LGPQTLGAGPAGRFDDGVEERGQTSTEYLGLLVVIAAVIGVLATGDLGGTLRNGILGGVCRIAGTGCDPDGPGHSRSEQAPGHRSEDAPGHRRDVPGHAPSRGTGISEAEEDFEELAEEWDEAEEGITDPIESMGEQPKESN
jgi:hypothetical protein